MKYAIRTTIIAVVVFLLTVKKKKIKQEPASQENLAPVASITTETVNDPNLVEIKERMFIAQVNNVYLNYNDYLEKTIKLEGLFKQEQAGTSNEPYCYVLRYGPGCCGDDGNVGFEVAWDKDLEKPYPDVDSWVEATGVLKIEERNTYKYLYLELASLTALNTRGVEKVTR
jgi:uncharacterized membrane protein YcgQ (UPF0703/DUF1980 family)